VGLASRIRLDLVLLHVQHLLRLQPGILGLANEAAQGFGEFVTGHACFHTSSSFWLNGPRGGPCPVLLEP
jgi:hypothetical protein